MEKRKGRLVGRVGPPESHIGMEKGPRVPLVPNETPDGTVGNTSSLENASFNRTEGIPRA